MNSDRFLSKDAKERVAIFATSASVVVLAPFVMGGLALIAALWWLGRVFGLVGDHILCARAAARERANAHERRAWRHGDGSLEWTLRRFRDLEETPRIYGAPGWQLYKIASWIYSPRTFREVFQPILSDMLIEYCEALAAGKHGKARWVRVRGSWTFSTHVIAQIPVSLTRLIWRLWASGGP